MGALCKKLVPGVHTIELEGQKVTQNWGKGGA